MRPCQISSNMSDCSLVFPPKISMVWSLSTTKELYPLAGYSGEKTTNVSDKLHTTPSSFDKYISLRALPEASMPPHQEKHIIIFSQHGTGPFFKII